MKNTRRLRVLCGELRPCARFADVGCDHGYCTQYMLERNLCRTAVISDISAGSLHKAETGRRSSPSSKRASCPPSSCSSP